MWRQTLINRTNLTIQDYFVFDKPRKAEVAGDAQSPFSKALEVAQSASAKNRQGLTIQDYMKNRIITQSPVWLRENQPTPSDIDVEESGPDFQTEPLSESEDPDIQGLQTNARPPADDTRIDDSGDILKSIDRAAARYQLPTAVIKAVIKAESGNQVRAVSPAGALGLMQLMPATAKEMGVDDPFDIDQNIHGGARYLRTMLNQFNGNLRLALSAYNAGPGTVTRYDGNVPYAETRNYVQRVLRYAAEFAAQGA